MYRAKHLGLGTVICQHIHGTVYGEGWRRISFISSFHRGSYSGSDTPVYPNCSKAGKVVHHCEVPPTPKAKHMFQTEWDIVTTEYKTYVRKL